MKAAEQGSYSAQYNVGASYNEGFGVGKDRAKAIWWFRKSAEQGHADAQFNLGQGYYHGDGINVDYVQAVSWWRKAADQGDAGALYHLGFCYLKGHGTVKDEIEAYAHLNLASVHNEKARQTLQVLHDHFSPSVRLRAQQRTRQLRREIDTVIKAKKVR